LSLNPDGKTLLGTESALRENDFKIISVSSSVKARFEVEMGRCGVFLASYITPVVIYKDLVNLFRRSCPDGLVIFLSQQSDEDIPDADIVLSDRDDPHAIVDRIRSRRRTIAS
jgi:hypothetical protein